MFAALHCRNLQVESNQRGREAVVERPIDFTFLGGLLALLPDNGAIHLLISRFLSNLMQIHSPGQTVRTDVLPVLLMVF